MFQMLKVSELKASAVNPRFEVTEIAELAESIKAHGIIEPLVVSHEIDGSHVILAGHRRAAAAEKAGLKEVPCIIRDKVESKPVLHLVENIQRVDLSPMETAMAVAQAQAGGIKAKDLAKQLGRSAAWVSKFTTIHKGWVKLENHPTKTVSERGMQQFVKETDADKLYAAARKVLGLDKVEEQKDLGLDKDDEELSESEQGEIEVIKELLELAKIQGKIAATATVSVEPHGKSGFRVIYAFKSEKQARAALDTSPI